MSVVSLLNFSRLSRDPVTITSPRSVLACEQEGIDPAVDFRFKDARDFVLVCKGDTVAAKLRAEHYLSRRDELIEIATKKREMLIEAAELAEQNSELLALSDGGSVSRTQGAATKKEKLMRQIQKMEQVVETNKQRQAALLEEAKAKLAVFAAQERERAQVKEREELEHKFKEVQLRRRAQQEKQVRLQREAERREKEERARLAREQVAAEFEKKERERLEKLERERQLAIVAAEEKQIEVAEKLDARKSVAASVERKRREEIEEKMADADRRREQLERQHQAQLEARKIASELKTKENRVKREKASMLYVQKITRFVEKAKAAEEQRQHQQEELRNYFLHCKIEEAKREKLRKEVFERVRQEEAQRDAEMQERLAVAEERIRAVMEEKQRNAAMRRVEKEMMLEDKLQQMLRNRRLLEHECEEGKAKYEEKIRRINELQREAEEADVQRRNLMRRSLLAITKRPPAVTPGPADYAVVSASEYVAPKDGGVKITSSTRPPLFAGDADIPGPGQYNTRVPFKSIRGGKLKPLAPLERRQLLAPGGSVASSHADRSASAPLRDPTATAPSDSTTRHALQARAATAALGDEESGRAAVGVTDADYDDDSDNDFEAL